MDCLSSSLIRGHSVAGCLSLILSKCSVLAHVHDGLGPVKSGLLTTSFVVLWVKRLSASWLPNILLSARWLLIEQVEVMRPDAPAGPDEFLQRLVIQSTNCQFVWSVGIQMVQIQRLGTSILFDSNLALLHTSAHQLWRSSMGG